jgi:hypothetical protein
MLPKSLMKLKPNTILPEFGLDPRIVGGRYGSILKAIVVKENVVSRIAFTPAVLRTDFSYLFSPFILFTCAHPTGPQ